jgi:hypothetical protein
VADPTTRELWIEAGGLTPDFSQERYLQLLAEHGREDPFEEIEGTGLLRCGWPVFVPREERHA